MSKRMPFASYRNGEIIVVVYEDYSKEILRMNSDVATDEIIGWCYLDDLI